MSVKHSGRETVSPFSSPLAALTQQLQTSERVKMSAPVSRYGPWMLVHSIGRRRANFIPVRLEKGSIT